MTHSTDYPYERRLVARRKRLSIDYDFCTRRAKGTHPKAAPLADAVHVSVARIRRQFLSHYFQSVPQWRIFLRRLSKQRVLPDFGVIGPVGSGTTDLAATVLAHPNVIYPLVKEFDTVDPQQWRIFYPTTTTFRRHTRRYGTCLSPFVGPYLHSLEVASNLSGIKPCTKIIINVRNPSELVFSEWKRIVLHTRKDVLARTRFITTFSSFVEKALEIFPATAGPIWGSLHNGIYCHSIAHWISYFGEENVRVFDIAEYFTNRGVYLQELCQFVGLPLITLPADLPIANRNPVKVEPPAIEATAKLREFFDPFNRRLWGVLGRAYDW